VNTATVDGNGIESAPGPDDMSRGEGNACIGAKASMFICAFCGRVRALAFE
jgi:hypothetical protein